MQFFFMLISILSAIFMEWNTFPDMSHVKEVFITFANLSLYDYATDSKNIFRIRLVPTSATRNHRTCLDEERLRRTDANRRRKVHLLPIACLADGGDSHRRLAPHLADEGPGRSTTSQRHCRKGAEQQQQRYGKRDAPPGMLSR